MGYTQTVVREFDTGEVTFRRIDTGEFVVIACFPAWKKSHMVHASYGPGNVPKVLDSIGQCFEYAKRHYPNCIIQRNVSKPLAVSDPYTHRLAEDEVSVG